MQDLKRRKKEKDTTKNEKETKENIRGKKNEKR